MFDQRVGDLGKMNKIILYLLKVFNSIADWHGCRKISCPAKNLSDYQEINCVTTQTFFLQN